MTVHADLPVSLARGRGLGSAATDDRSARMLGSARLLFLRGLAVLAAAILLGIAEALAVWMGALLVALGLLLVAAGVALAGVISRVSVRPHH